MRLGINFSQTTRNIEKVLIGSARPSIVFAVDKEEEQKLLHRVEALKGTLALKQKVHLTLITTFGLIQGKHSGKIQKVVIMDDLFA